MHVCLDRCMHPRSLQSCPTLCDPLTIAHQAPLSMGFSRQEYWSGLPFPSPGNLPDPGIKPTSLMSPPLAGAGYFTTRATDRCPSTNEWINKLRYIYTMEYYSAMKRNTFESVLMRWMNLEPIIQSEVRQKEKDK